MPDAAAGFVRRILADPVDALPRLVFADWLEESGTEANAVWARYLRLRARAANDPSAVDREVARTEADAVGPLVEARLRVPATAFAGSIGALLDLLPAANLTVTVEAHAVPRPTLGRVGEADAERWRGLPLASGGGRVLLGMVNPADAEAVGELARLAGGLAVAVEVPGDQLADLVNRTFTRALALPAVSVEVVSVGTEYSPLDPTRDQEFEALVEEARADGTSGLEIIARRDGYDVDLLVNGRPVEWRRVGGEHGCGLIRAAEAAPARRLGVWVRPRWSKYGYGVRVVFVTYVD